MSELLPDIPRIYTALAEWMACMLYILPQRKRISRQGVAVIAAMMFVVMAVFLVATGNVPIAWWVPCMAVAVGLMYLLLWLCCDIPAAAAGYYCARAFILAEFAASVMWQAYCLLAPLQAPIWPLSLVVMLPGYALVYGGMWRLQRKDEEAELRIGGKSLLSAVVMALAVFGVSNVGFVQTGNVFGGTGYSLFYVRTLVDFAGVLILTIQHRQLYEAALRQELDALDRSLHRQYEQYKQSKESIHLINRRYHDLKMQIAAIKAERDPGKQAAALAEMESGIKMYEAQNKTGNPVLDTLLTAKSIYCQQHDINLTCVADGHLLDKLSAQDICTIVGTALDNATESVRALPDAEQRLIRAAIYAQNGFVMLRFENYCAAGQNAAPTREGYGIKSIRATAQKYGGTVTVHCEENWFTLRVLIPV